MKFIITNILKIYYHVVIKYYYVRNLFLQGRINVLREKNNALKNKEKS